MSAPPCTVRRYLPQDQAAVLALIARDQPIGQPPVTPAMLDEARAGRSTVDAGWWADLRPPRTDVAVTGDGIVEGVVSYAIRPADDTGLILWMHGREDPVVLGTLIRHAAHQLGRRRLEACAFASALSLGQEGLPVERRAATDAALRAAGFRGSDLWRYMHRTLPTTPAGEIAAEVTVTDSSDPDGWRLEIERDGTCAAEALIGRPIAGIGVLWWIHVDPDHRGHGLGRTLLARALDELHSRGADQVILYVDDDEAPGGDRDRSAANRLYDAAGFVEVDRLCSYLRSPR